MTHYVHALYLTCVGASVIWALDHNAMCVLAGLLACFAHDWIADNDPDSPFAPEQIKRKPGVIYS